MLLSLEKEGESSMLKAHERRKVNNVVKSESNACQNFESLSLSLQHA